MAKCNFCKAQIGVAERCPYCGDLLGRYAATFIFGTNKSQGESCEVYVTTKYIIIRKRTTGSFLGETVAFAAGGILLASAVSNAHQKNMKELGYYPIANIKHAIYPYINNGIKNRLAIKIVNKDDTDFILYNNLNGLSGNAIVKRFVNTLTRAAIPFVDGSNRNFGNVYCAKPFVGFNNFASYSAPVLSTAPAQGNVGNPGGNIPGQTQAQNFQTTQNAIPTPMPATQTMPQPTPMPAYQQPLQNKPKFCFKCGAPLESNDKFCLKCGEKI